MANALVKTYSRPGDVVMDPFSGSGAIPLESLILGRNIICADTNSYAVTLTRGKLGAPLDVQSAHQNFSKARQIAGRNRAGLHAKTAPNWVRSFFHPRTLAEIMSFMSTFKRQGDYFLTSCLLGILHHQRPGFLSYPSSHLIPYLRDRRFPKALYPELYEYRAVEPRLSRKIERAYRRPAKFDQMLSKRVYHSDATRIRLDPGSVDSIITSPPYMDALDYGRDNRLRLWFLGVEDYKDSASRFGSLDRFSSFMSLFFLRARRWLRKGGYCILVIGDVNSRGRSIDVARTVVNIATSGTRHFKLESILTDRVPDERRSRRGLLCTETESIVALRRT